LRNSIFSRVFTLAVLTSVSVAGLSVASQAGDIASTSYDWSGGYVGATVGAAEHRARYLDIDQDWYNGSAQHRSRGFALGAGAGYNWQNGPVVLGVEGDFSFLSNKNKELFSGDVYQRDKAQWLATLRGRTGLAIDSTLLYLTGGLAIADFERSWEEFEDVDDSWPNMGKTKLGGVIGVGMERALGGGWSFKTESLIAKFGVNSDQNVNGYRMLMDDTVFVTRLGLNYNFGGAGEVVSSEGTPHDFSGAYGGLSIGGHQATTSLTDIDYFEYGHTADLLSYGVVGGAQLGYNMQSDAQVTGLELDVAFATGKASENAEDTNPSRTPFANHKGSTGFNAALKFKNGVAAGNLLTYIVAGAAIGEYNAAYNDFDDGGFNVDATRLGLIVGTGMEYAYSGNLTTKIEATYTMYGSKTVAGTGDADEERARGSANDFAIRAGLNYYLGDRPDTQSAGVIVPTTNWSGGYVGVQLGVNHHVGKIHDRVFDNFGGDYALPTFGGVGGAVVGADMQMGSYVFGALADFNLLTNSKKDVNSDGDVFKSDVDWIATVRGRGGLATGNSLLYLTGGLAIADANLLHDDDDVEPFNISSTRFGAVGGIGVEHKISENLSLSTELLYTRFLTEKASNGETCNVNFGGTEPCEMDGFDDNISAKMSLNYRF
jgi:opacity protein-like surface antigen